MDDRGIVALYLRRDETAIRQTAEKYGSRLRTLAYGIVNDLQTAEECENDTYTWRHGTRSRPTSQATTSTPSSPESPGTFP